MLLLTAGFASACASASGSSAGAGGAAFERSLRSALALYDTGEYVRAAHAFHALEGIPAPNAHSAFRSAGAGAYRLRRSRTLDQVLVAECTAWLRAERMAEFGSCTSRLAALPDRTPGRDPAVNALIALGAIAAGRPAPAVPVPSSVDRLIHQAAQEGV